MKKLATKFLKSILPPSLLQKLGCSTWAESVYMEKNLKLSSQEVINIIQDRILRESKYFGIPTFKFPFDFWMYQEIIYEVQPDIIIEIGNRFGGSTLALAHILDNLNHGQVIAVDIDHSHIYQQVRDHPRITFITGDAGEKFSEVEKAISPNSKVLVIEDSSHTYDDTLNILRLYGNLVNIGSYCIIEDSIIYHGVNEGPRPGPYEAIETFLEETEIYECDRSKERYVITWNPTGFLKRVK